MLDSPQQQPHQHRLIERRLYLDGPEHQLEWMQARAFQPRGTIFAPPLVGADGLLSIRYLRPLRINGYNLLSFNYAGHGLSSRPFSIRQSFSDTDRLLAFARRHPQRFSPPLHGVGICYAATPLLYVLQQRNEPLPRIALINAIPQLFSRNLIHSFWDFRRNLQSERWRLGDFGNQVRRYADFLLPGITINRRQFGILALRRIRVIQTLVDWLASRHLRRVRLAHTAVLCLYASQDRLFRAFRYFDTPRDYEKAIRRICPQVRFVRLPGDHFLTRAHSRQQALAALTSFFNPCARDHPPQEPIDAQAQNAQMVFSGSC